MRRPRLLLVFLAAGFVILADDFPYHHPPKEVEEVLNAAPTPVPSVSPQHDSMIFLQPLRYPPIAEVAQPMLRLGGIRIDTNTNGYAFGALLPVVRVEAASRMAPTSRSPPPGTPSSERRSGARTASSSLSPIRPQHGIELWIGSSATGDTHRIDGVSINGVRVTVAADGEMPWNGSATIARSSSVWFRPGAALLQRELAIPKGPHVQESLGHAGPAPTYEDLLSTPHDEDLFDYYATSQLAYLDVATGKLTPFGKPGIYTTVRPSPDQKHLLVGWLHKPYSYQLPATDFPQEVEVWDREGKSEYKVASLPLAEHVPLAGVRTGPRSYQWLPDKSATLTWVEALDGGDPKEKVPHRDRIVLLSAPFSGQPQPGLPDQGAIPRDAAAGQRQGAGGRVRARTARVAHSRDRSRKPGARGASSSPAMNAMPIMTPVRRSRRHRPMAAAR